MNWTRIKDQSPAVGDIIACRAEHRDGGLFYWAGEVIGMVAGRPRLLIRGEKASGHILKFDTEWLLLPKD